MDFDKKTPFFSSYKNETLKDTKEENVSVKEEHKQKSQIEKESFDLNQQLYQELSLGDIVKTKNIASSKENQTPPNVKSSSFLDSEKEDLSQKKLDVWSKINDKKQNFLEQGSENKNHLEREVYKTIEKEQKFINPVPAQNLEQKKADQLFEEMLKKDGLLPPKMKDQVRSPKDPLEANQDQGFMPYRQETKAFLDQKNLPNQKSGEIFGTQDNKINSKTSSDLTSITRKNENEQAEQSLGTSKEKEESFFEKKDKKTLEGFATKQPELAKKRLGRGLASLMGTEELRFIQGEDNATQKAMVESLKSALTEEKILLKSHAEIMLPLEKIVRNEQNPRLYFAEEELAELADSIKQHGLLQPVLVRKKGQDRYQLIAGERRWRAAKQAGLKEIPALVREIDDKTALEVALIENVQRYDLNPMEEALAYKQLIDQFHYKQADLSQIIGKSRSHVTNLLRLLKLPLKVQNLLQEGHLTNGHARALVNAPDSAQLADYIVKEGLSVRQTEALIQQQIKDQSEGDLKRDEPSQLILSKDEKEKISAHKDRLKIIVQNLKQQLPFNISIHHNAQKDKGVLKIEYQSLEGLEALYQSLKKDSSIN